VSCVTILLDRGADIYAMDKKGDTALSIATDPKIIALLNCAAAAKKGKLKIIER
jgi:ankyrin repeat protein